MGFSHCTRISSRPTLLVVLTALLFFVVGPQLGSVDADGDGIPEVSVILASSTNTIGVTTFTSKAAFNRTVRAFAIRVAVPVSTPEFDSEEHTIPSSGGRSGLRLFSLLRC